MEIDTRVVGVGDIKLNPDNPRTIQDRDMAYLVKSITDFPDMMRLREIVVDETMTVLGGNMRLLALRQAGEKSCTVKVVSGLTPERKREFIIKDNGSYGRWSDDLANLWSDLPLIEWGVDLPGAWLSQPTGGEEKRNAVMCPKCGETINAE